MVFLSVMKISTSYTSTFGVIVVAPGLISGVPLRMIWNECVLACLSHCRTLISAFSTGGGSVKSGSGVGGPVGGRVPEPPMNGVALYVRDDELLLRRPPPKSAPKPLRAPANPPVVLLVVRNVLNEGPFGRGLSDAVEDAVMDIDEDELEVPVCDVEAGVLVADPAVVDILGDGMPVNLGGALDIPAERDVYRDEAEETPVAVDDDDVPVGELSGAEFEAPTAEVVVEELGRLDLAGLFKPSTAGEAVFLAVSAAWLLDRAADTTALTYELDALASTRVGRAVPAALCRETSPQKILDRSLDSGRPVKKDDKSNPLPEGALVMLGEATAGAGVAFAAQDTVCEVVSLGESGEGRAGRAIDIPENTDSKVAGLGEAAGGETAGVDTGTGEI
jgi:hypothetical protein